MSTAKMIGFTLVMLTLSACKKPTENIKIILDTDVIKNTAMINVTDAQTGNPAPSNATISAAQKQQVVNIAITKTGTTAPPIVIPPPPVYNNTTLTFVGRCPNRTDLEIRPSVYVYFKKTSSSGAFQYLGYMEKGNITTNLLALNETYDFQIVYGGATYRTSQKIEQTSYNLTIDMPEACKF
ncbi:MAG: hypothetical protein EOO91_15740 [Pedobacter sp.]|nr:MAG: hypothetical protein EOO91_15740 [Pedobacter sp.]